MNKTQAWFHSWYADILGLHLIPFVFVCLAIFDLPPFGNYDPAITFTLVGWILILDWAHIFAQWHRIYGNPAESSHLKWVYPVSFFLLVPFLTLILYFETKFYVETLLVYFVIYHFIKQQYGYIRVYMRTDGAKGRVESLIESSFIYLSMVTPMLYWHTSFPLDRFGWNQYFIKIPIIQNLFYPALVCYGVALLGYLYFEVKRIVRNRNFNFAKNIAMLVTVLGWGLISVLSESKILVFFTVVLTHDASYIFFVWLIGRRDKQILSGEVPWKSWWSLPGLGVYVVFLICLSQLVLLIHHRLTGNDLPNVVFGSVLNVFQGTWAVNLGFGLYFATQAHHYFIDRFLWKKEKDFAYLVKTGKISLPSK